MITTQIDDKNIKSICAYSRFSNYIILYSPINKAIEKLMSRLQLYLEKIDCMNYGKSIHIKGLISSNDIDEVLQNDNFTNQNQILAVINFPNDSPFYTELPNNIFYELRLPSDQDGVYGEQNWNNSFFILPTKFMSSTCEKF